MANEADTGRLDAKMTGAKVIDLAEVKARINDAKNNIALTSPVDIVTASLTGFFLLALIALLFFASRR